LIGKGSIGALTDAEGAVAWCCFPRFDGDPAFCRLLSGEKPANACGSFTIELEGGARIEQQYLQDTPILVTRLFDGNGNELEITDFCPRYEERGQLVCPQLFVRQLRPIGGRPSVRVKVSPASNYGCGQRHASLAANHIDYGGEPPLRLSINAPAEPIIDAVPFYVQETITLAFGVDQPFADGLASVAAKMLKDTTAYWRTWVRKLETPREWRDEVVRAAITLAL